MKKPGWYSYHFHSFWKMNTADDEHHACGIIYLPMRVESPGGYDEIRRVILRQLNPSPPNESYLVITSLSYLGKYGES
jgi:hypothetical protein